MMKRLWIMIFLIPVTSLGAELKVLTWNTFLLPPPINMTKQSARAAIMVKTLPRMDHDVMLFQETFFDRKRNDLIHALKETHPYIVVPQKGKKIWHIQDSGLFVASKFPLQMLDLIIFKNCAKSDCLASKSAMLIEVTLPDGQSIQMVNTHLQAWSEPRTFKIRQQQLEQIKSMLARHVRAGVPQVLIGDLNVDGNVGTEYADSLELMEMDSTPLSGELTVSNGFSTKGCFKKPGGDNAEWLDHFWVKPNGSPILVENKQVLPLFGILNKTVCPLSDHHAVEARIRL